MTAFFGNGDGGQGWWRVGPSQRQSGYYKHWHKAKMRMRIPSKLFDKTLVMSTQMYCQFMISQS